MIKIQIKNTKDVYNLLEDWGKKRNFPSPPMSFLPESSLVAYGEGDIPIYYLSIYNTDSHVLWIGWEFSNPEIEKELRRIAFSNLLDFVKDFARINNYKHIITTSATPPVEKGLTDSGFIQADVSINQYIKNI